MADRLSPEDVTDLVAAVAEALWATSDPPHPWGAANLLEREDTFELARAAIAVCEQAGLVDFSEEEREALAECVQFLPMHASERPAAERAWAKLRASLPERTEDG